MLDINLGNKTLVVGVLIALILSYGMVNFDSGSAAKQNGTAIQAALQNVSATDSSMATASTSVETTAADILASPVDGVTVQTDAKPTSMMLQKMEKENRKLERELRHQDRM